MTTNLGKETKARLKKCKICGSRFETFDSFRQWCSPDCGVKLAQITQEKARQKAVEKRNREEMAKIKAAKERLKSRSEWLNDLQKIFNKFIRLRDRDKPCISCGRFHQGKYDAGHYRTVGGCPELRFNEDNCHAQCVPCNRYKHGNQAEYRIGLINRIGIERVEILEQKHPPLKLTKDEIKDLIKVYKAKVKELE